MAADDAVGRIADGEVELGGEMVAQRGLRREAALEPVRTVLEGAARTAIGPADDGKRVRAARVEAGDAGLLALEDVVEPGAEPVLHAFLRIQALRAGKALGIGGMTVGMGEFAIELDWKLARLVALQQRIAFEFALDEMLQFEMRQLQELDRLQQLRRHDQGLPLAQLHARHHRHCARNPFHASAPFRHASCLLRGA